jgi:hypothetical protein
VLYVFFAIFIFCFLPSVFSNLPATESSEEPVQKIPYQTSS